MGGEDLRPSRRAAGWGGWKGKSKAETAWACTIGNKNQRCITNPTGGGYHFFYGLWFSGVGLMILDCIGLRIHVTPSPMFQQAGVSAHCISRPQGKASRTKEKAWLVTRERRGRAGCGRRKRGMRGWFW